LFITAAGLRLDALDAGEAVHLPVEGVDLRHAEMLRNYQRAGVCEWMYALTLLGRHVM
jgi:hypothetical protein